MRNYLLFIFLILTLGPVKAQTVGIKTNILYDATASVNLGLEQKGITSF